MKWNELKRGLTGMTAAALAVMLIVPANVKADAVEKPYLSLGADLSAKEKATVLDLLDVDEDELDEYTVVKVTNEDEHEALDNYLSASVIGSRALSSVLIEKKEKGHGIEVSTENISYCTKGMYQNALTTAGIEDAEVKVAGPFSITGTAALVGAMNAYEDMTGEDISSDSKDAATNELVITSELADSLDDSEKAEQFLALVKEEVLSQDVKDTDDIMQVVDDCAEQLEVTLTEEQRAQIIELMEKINGLGLDVDEIKRQAGEIYDKLSQLDLNQLESSGFFEKVKTALSSIFAAIKSLF